MPLTMKKQNCFIKRLLNPLGYSLQTEFVAVWNTEFPTQRACAFGVNDKPIFWIIESKVEYTPRHMAFSANKREHVDQFYKQSLAAGGTNNGEPGARPIYHEHYYGAFVYDPDGNNVEAVCHAPQ